MTKALTYVEIDVPDPRCVVHLAFDHGFTDTNAAGSTHIWTAAGVPDTDNSVVAFGSRSLSIDGDGAITTPDSADYTFGSGDFSIEFYFFKNVAAGTERQICGQRLGIGGANTTRSFNIDFDSAGHCRGLVYQGSTEIACTGSAVFGVSTTFHHVSFNRIGSSLLLFVDGILAASNTISGAINDSSGKLAVGQDGDDTSGRWIGWIDEFTICRYARRSANFTPEPTFFDNFTPALPEPSRTLRFALDTGYLPRDIDAIPNLLEVNIDPAIVSLGADLGQRATVTATFRDHKHIFALEAFASGTFWGKFRAYYGLRLQAYPFRVITGALGQSLASMETRHFVIDSSNGPSPDGKFIIVAKDVLKFADGDRAQAPLLSNGFLSANIDNADTAATLAPAGIGNDEYPASGFIAIGGTEIMQFTRSGDSLTFVDRGHFNTDPVSHTAQDRVQLVKVYNAEFVTNIIFDLLVNYADVPRSYIDENSWQTEVENFLGTVYTAAIAEPTSVNQLISELIEQVGLVMWWDDSAQLIKLQLLRPIASTADIFNGDNYLANSLQVTEQPEKRLSQVFTYFAKINPLKPDEQTDNYRSTAFAIDDEAEAAYGTAAIKKIFSRWIPAGGRAIAANLNAVLLARFRDPPRRIAFNVMRGSVGTPAVGVGYQIGGWPFQQRDGSAATVPAQITRLNPRADIFEVEVEEISATSAVPIGSPGVHVVTIDGSIFNVNLRTMHDSIYGVPVSGNEVRCTINGGVIIGSTSSAPAFDIGTWPAGVLVTLTIFGRIAGHGGDGGAGSGSAIAIGAGGLAGSTALFTRKAITLQSAAGQIWGGGGGGGGGGSGGNVGGNKPLGGGNGGSGGAGVNPGVGGPGGGGTNIGSTGITGSDQAGGASVPPNVGGGGAGGAGGGPGLAGAAGAASPFAIHTAGGLGGAAGAAIDGVSFVTTVGGAGDRRGGQIN